jgi:hypothetical protein
MKKILLQGFARKDSFKCPMRIWRGREGEIIPAVPVPGQIVRANSDKLSGTCFYLPPPAAFPPEKQLVRPKTRGNQNEKFSPLWVSGRPGHIPVARGGLTWLFLAPGQIDRANPDKLPGTYFYLPPPPFQAFEAHWRARKEARRRPFHEEPLTPVP